MDLDGEIETAPGIAIATPSEDRDRGGERELKGKTVVATQKKKETLGDRLQRMVDAEAILDRVLTSEVTMSIKELIALSEPMRDLIFKKRGMETAIKENETLAGVNLVARRRPILVANSPKVRVLVNGGEPLVTILDTGADMNVITRQAADKFGLAIRNQSEVSMVPYTGDASTFCGVCENVEVALGGLRVL